MRNGNLTISLPQTCYFSTKAQSFQPTLDLLSNLSYKKSWSPKIYFIVVVSGLGAGTSVCACEQFYQNIVLFKNTKMSSQQIQEIQPTEVAGFIAKTFEILNNQEFAKIAYWAPSGSEFIIKDVNKFQQIVLPKYFRHSKMNSFIRQLNMYGFHKSRADHTKSVFSHPSFLRGRPDLLITIKRKIKGKIEQKTEQSMETPLKKRPEVQVTTTTSKNVVETGNELTTVRQFQQSFNNISFNILGTKQKINSIMNLNCSVNALPQPDMANINLDDGIEESDDQASIADKIEVRQDKEEWRVAPGPSYKFVNPSCFFSSMRKDIN